MYEDNPYNIQISWKPGMAEKTMRETQALSSIRLPQLGLDRQQCSRYCSGGNRCYCRSEVPHQLHICSNRNCVCHSRERYEGKL